MVQETSVPTSPLARSDMLSTQLPPAVQGNGMLLQSVFLVPLVLEGAYVPAGIVVTPVLVSGNTLAALTSNS